MGPGEASRPWPSALSTVSLLSGPFLLSQIPGTSSQEQAAGWGLWGDTEPCPPFPPPALALFLGKQPWAPGLYFRKASQFGRANTAEEKDNTCKIAPGPQRRVFLVFSLTFSSGLQPRMCPVFSSWSLPHRPPHPWCLQFPEVNLPSRDQISEMAWSCTAGLGPSSALPQPWVSSGVPGRSVGPGVGCLDFSPSMWLYDLRQVTSLSVPQSPNL